MSHPIQIEESVTIARSPELVWSAVADYGTDTTWRKGLAEMTPDPPGPPAVGTKVHEELTTGGRSYVADSIVTHVGPMTYRFEGSGTLGKLAGSRTVVTGASPSEAVFTYQIEITPSGMNRLIRPIIARTARRGLRGDLQRLRDLLEQG
jgi:Polyketide cyclase / dehydrase and lipid transport